MHCNHPKLKKVNPRKLKQHYKTKMNEEQEHEININLRNTTNMKPGTTSNFI